MGEQVAARLWGHSSVGRAPALQAGGREFESLSLHSKRFRMRDGMQTCLRMPEGRAKSIWMVSRTRNRRFRVRR